MLNDCIKPNWARTGAVCLAAYLLLVVMMAGTLPTPLYTLYAKQLDLSPLLVTLVFATYAVAILFTLLLFGKLSDLLGRRAVFGIGVGLACIGVLVFLFQPTFVGLLSGRFLSGMAVGLMVGTTTAYLAELLHNRPLAALISSLCNMSGLGLGALLSGSVAEYAAQPLCASYQTWLIMLLPVLLLHWMPETVQHNVSLSGLRLQRLRVPSEIRHIFMAVAAAVLCGFSFLGLFAALVGRFLAVGLHLGGFLLSGAIVFSAFFSATIGQLLAVWLSSRRAVLVGAMLLPAGLACIWLAFHLASMFLFLLSAVLGGVGAGCSSSNLI